MKKFLPFILVIFVIMYSCSNEDKNPLEDLEESQPIDSVIVEKNVKMPEKCIYLTIDDVPLNGSKYIDSVITAEKIKANVFLVGKIIDESKKFADYYEMFKKNSYVEIYNHSYSHAGNRYAAFYKNPQTVLADFEKNQTEFSMASKIARLPGRNLWNVGGRTKNYRQSGSTSADLLVANDYDVYGWDIEWNYNAKDYNPKQTVDELMAEIETLYEKDRLFTFKHVVLLMHNQMFGKMTTKNDLAELITKLKEREFSFEYLSTYPKEIEKTETNV